jgi:hypothetical protein
VLERKQRNGEPKNRETGKRTAGNGDSENRGNGDPAIELSSLFHGFFLFVDYFALISHLSASSIVRTNCLMICS